MFSDESLRHVRYRYTQRAGLLLLVLGGAIAVTLIVGSGAVAEWDPLALAVLLIPVQAVLEVVVDDEALQIAFDTGLVRYVWSPRPRPELAGR